MLVLARKVGETLLINNDIKVTIIDIDGRQAKVGIDAPKSVSILREELKDGSKLKKQRLLDR